jgi:hypothetical protein
MLRQLEEFLGTHGARHERIDHREAFTSQEEAAAAHVSGWSWAKVVIVRRMRLMKTHCKTLIAWVLIPPLISLAASGWAEAETVRHAGVVVAVDKAAGTIVVGDVGPKLPSGESKITRYTMHVTPSSELIRVKRAAGTAPSGWFGDYVETSLPTWDVKPGDWVTATAEADKQRLTAVKIVVVDTTEP